jgi:aryl-alcohol dehydrogenase-like predicted oxidoreductase
MDMQYRRLGRTGLNVSVLSLGSGGPNRLGQSRYVPRQQIRRLVHRALELGVNFFDTSSAYEHSETVLGNVLKGVPRNDYYLASKVFPLHGGKFLCAADIRRMVERSLQRLRVTELDILQLHRITPEIYESARDHMLPVLEKMRSEGIFRYIGITESSGRDPMHRMLKLALQDDLFDTIMVACDLVNTSAEGEILPLARANDVGVIGMSAARHLVPRNATARLKLLSGFLAGLVTSPPSRGQLKVRLRKILLILAHSGPKPLPPITRAGSGGPLQLPESAYTFVTSQPAIATVLTGTTDVIHLERNVAAALAPALTAEEIELLQGFLH